MIQRLEVLDGIPIVLCRYLVNLIIQRVEERNGWKKTAKGIQLASVKFSFFNLPI